MLAIVICAVLVTYANSYAWPQSPNTQFETAILHNSTASGQRPAGSGKPSTVEVTTANQERATLLVLNALRQSVWGPPVSCRIGQSIKLFGRQLTGFGQYAHAGQGSGKMKMSIRFAAGDQLNSFHQVSDGRLIYTYHLIGETSERSRVNLERVRDCLGIVTHAHLEDPIIAMYLAIGGQPEVLRKLCQQYRWIEVQPGKIDDANVWWLTGELASAPASTRALAEIDTLLLKSNISGLMPQHVRIALGRGDPMPLWLYRVEQSCSKPMLSVGDSYPLVAVMEFSEPQIVTNMPIEMFQDENAESNVVPLNDETNKYLPPTPVTAQRMPILNRLR